MKDEEGGLDRMRLRVICLVGYDGIWTVWYWFYMRMVGGVGVLELMSALKDTGPVCFSHDVLRVRDGCTYDAS